MGIHRELELLNPELKAAVLRTFKTLDSVNFKYLVSETLRDKEVQEAYFAQGRKSLEEVNALRKKVGLYLLKEAENLKTVTNCDGVKHLSNHQCRDGSGLGSAIDIVPAYEDNQGRLNFWWAAPQSVWEYLGHIAESCGLDWCYGGKGEHWGWDSPHFELLKDFVVEEPKKMEGC